MPEPDRNLFQLFTQKLNALGIPYMVTGSVAAIAYGEPRLTHDIDLVLTLSSSLINEFSSLFPGDAFYCPPPEVLKSEIARKNRGHCNLIHLETGFKADLYFSGQDELMNWALQHVKPIQFLDSVLPLAPVEYVILKKLEFYSEGKSFKHIDDIRAILRNSSDQVDIPFLMVKIRQLGLDNAWQLCDGNLLHE